MSQRLDLIRVINISSTDRHKNVTVMTLRSQMWLYVRRLLHVITGSLIKSVINLSVVKLQFIVINLVLLNFKDSTIKGQQYQDFM